MSNDDVFIDETDLTQERQDLCDLQSERLAKKFTSRRINFYNACDVKAAQEKIKELIVGFKADTPQTKVGFSDSVTLHQVNAFDVAKNIPGVEVINPFERFADGKYVSMGKQPPGKLNLPKDEYYAVMEKVFVKIKESIKTDVFIVGANAITMKGQIVSTDGLGNRVSGMVFGPKKVIIVVGRNKIVKDVDEAIKRTRNIAAPLNYIRHNIKHHNRFDPPCLTVGYCVDCNHPRRACLNTVIVDGAIEANKDRLHLILVNEDLGL